LVHFSRFGMLGPRKIWQPWHLICRQAGCGILLALEWKPQQLLEMVKEIDKICPEEGMPNIALGNQDPTTNHQNSQTQGTNNSDHE
jgi:hypothetical protein